MWEQDLFDQRVCVFSLLVQGLSLNTSVCDLRPAGMICELRRKKCTILSHGLKPIGITF